MKRTILESKCTVCGTEYCKYSGSNSSQTNRRLQLLISCRLVWIKMISEVQVGWLYLTDRSFTDSITGLVIRALGVHVPDLSMPSCVWLHLELGHWLMYFSIQIENAALLISSQTDTEVRDQHKNSPMSNSQKPRKWWNPLKVWIYSQKASGGIWQLLLLTSARKTPPRRDLQRLSPPFITCYLIVALKLFALLFW